MKTIEYWKNLDPKTKFYFSDEDCKGSLLGIYEGLNNPIHMLLQKPDRLTTKTYSLENAEKFINVVEE